MNIIIDVSVTVSRMPSTRTSRLAALESRTGSLFLVAGFLLAGVALYKGVAVVTGGQPSALVDIGYGGLALLFPIVALLSLYPRLRADGSRLAALGLGSAIVSGLFVIAIWGWLAGAILDLGRVPEIPGEAPVWTAAALLGNFITLSLGFILTGGAVRRVDSIPSSVGLLLAIPGLMWLALILNIVLQVVPNFDLVVYVVNAVAVLATGTVLRGSENQASATNELREPAARGSDSP